MPRDLLQIALEHHHAGRLRQAEAGYHAALAENPDNAEAVHWLGVLAYQAGQFAEAVQYLERAAALRPGDAAFSHNLAQAYLGSRQMDKAIAAFQRAVQAEPMRAETLMGLGMAHLARASAGDAEAAVSVFRQAERSEPPPEDLYRCLGVALLGAGRAEEALAALRTALEKKPLDATAYYYMAIAYRTLGQTKDVRKSLMKALESDQSLARAWHALAVLEVEAGNLPQAAALFGRAIAARPDYAPSYQGLGHVREAQGKLAESLEAFRRAVQASRPDKAAISGQTLAGSLDALERKLVPEPAIADMHYGLATISNIFAPPRVPAWAIAELFNRYADTFDEHLQQKLQYHVPELIAQHVAKNLAAANPGHLLDVLDMGCGTGLCGMHLRPLAAKLAGVDLSPAMIEKAKARGIYDHLEVGDLIDVLKKSPREFDLLTAADVFIYLGELSAAFEGAASALRPGGLMIFSVEAGEGDRYRLQHKSRRFNHSKPYLQRLTSIHGFAEESFEPIIVRFEAEKPVPGYLVMLRLPAI